MRRGTLSDQSCNMKRHETARDLPLCRCRPTCARLVGRFAGTARNRRLLSEVKRALQWQGPRMEADPHATDASGTLRLDEAAIDAARQHGRDGAVAPTCSPWRSDIVRLLNEAL